MRTKSPTRLFPFLSGLWIRVTHLDYKNPHPACVFLYPHVAACEPSSKRVKVKSTHRADQVLKLNDYHISRHVVSTFKRLTTTATHCDLINFSLNRRGLIQKYSALTPPIGLIVAACSKHSTPIILATDRKSLDFYRTISLAN